MRRRRSVWVRTGWLETRVSRRPHVPPPNLKALTDEELEALLPLAERLAAGDGDPAWTAEELALVERLAAKAATVHQVSLAVATGQGR